MGVISNPHAVKLICGILAASEDLLPGARAALVALFGETDLESEIWPFDFTDYYRAEMGSGLLRQFVSFRAPFDPGGLAAAKLATDRLERQFCVAAGEGGARRVNLDPGYITGAKLVLATTKDFSHRLYLRDGIFAEVTLGFKRGGTTTFPWTYPDYASGRYDRFLLEVRSMALALERSA